MRGVFELIHRRHGRQLVTAIDQDFGIAREGRGIAGHRDHQRHLALCQFARLRVRALARRIENHGVEALQFRRGERAAEEIALLHRDGFETRRMRGLSKRLERGRVGIDGGDFRFFRKPQRERADAAEEIGNVFGFPGVIGDQARERLFTKLRRLQERTRRQDQGRAAHPHRRGDALRRHLAMTRDARELVCLRDPRQRAGLPGSERSGTAHIDIEAVQGRGHLDIERLLQRRQRFRDCPGRGNRSGHRGCQHRAGIDRDERVRTQGGEADFENIARRVLARMQHGAPPAVAMRVDQRADICIDLRLLERCDDEIALPGAIGRFRPMLGGAAAANPEMRTERRDAVGRGRFDAQKIAPVRMARNGFGFGGFAGQRVGNKGIPVRGRGDAIAAMADMRNDKPLAHRTLLRDFYGERAGLGSRLLADQRG